MSIPLDGMTRQYNPASITLPSARDLIVPSFNADGVPPTIPQRATRAPGIALDGQARIASPFPGLGDAIRALFENGLKALFRPHQPQQQTYFGAPPGHPYQAPPEYSAGTQAQTSAVFSSLTASIS